MEQIETIFGKEVAEVVDVVTHLQSIYKIKLSADENLMMLKRMGNKRWLYVKLSDRLHNMRTIRGHKNLKKQEEIAVETVRFFIPLARHLRLHQMVDEFEKICGEVFSNQR